MKDNKKIKVTMLSIIIVMLILVVVMFLILLNLNNKSNNNKASSNNEDYVGKVNSNNEAYIDKVNSNNEKYIGNYRLEKVSFENDVFEYKNDWKYDEINVKGTFTIKYDEENHKITKRNKIKANKTFDIYRDVEGKSTSIEGDLILSDDKKYILVYDNGDIPYTNSKENTFGVINSKIGYNFELENNQKIIDIFPLNLVSSIKVFISDDVTNKENLKAKLNKVSGVRNIKFVSKEDALEEMKEMYKDNSDIFEGYDGENNIFPDSYILTFETDEDAEKAKKEIEDWDDIKSVALSAKNTAQAEYQSIYCADMIIKENDKFVFATNNSAMSSVKNKIDYSKDEYIDIYVARNNDKEIQGYIVEKENNKKVFLDRSKFEVTDEYNFINFVEKDSKSFIVCSNSKIKSKSDFKDAKFEVYDINGNSVNINSKDFIELLEIEQKNYRDKNSLEYILFE